MWIVKNCEKSVFLVFKHIFLAVLYFLAAGSRKAAQMHSDPVNSLHVVICGKIKVCFSSSHPSESSGGLSAFYQPNSINVFCSGHLLKSAFCISCFDKINVQGQTWLSSIAHFGVFCATMRLWHRAKFRICWLDFAPQSVPAWREIKGQGAEIHQIELDLRRILRNFRREILQETLHPVEWKLEDI